jgi:hypothetical protein
VKGKWRDVKTTEKDAVRDEKKKLEGFVGWKRAYSRDVRAGLEEHSINYDIFEYGCDLKEPPRQLETVRHLKSVLGAPISDKNITEAVFLQRSTLKKQSQVPLSQQVENWEEVVELGYGGEVEEWEDLFRR